MGFWNISGGRIFISYRRDDSQVITERIYDRLVTAFGKDKVFKDLSSIAPGATFADVIHDELGRCGAVLVVIGPQWTTIPHPDGTPRIAKSDDWVHMEVALALKRRGIRVIPLLVQGASLPDSRSLPPDLQSLVEHNAHPVRNDPTFDGDMERLIGALSQALQVKTQAGPRNQGPVGGGMKVATWVIGIMAVGCFGFFALGWLGSGASPTRESSIDSTAKIAIDSPDCSDENSVPTVQMTEEGASYGPYTESAYQNEFFVTYAPLNELQVRVAAFYVLLGQPVSGQTIDLPRTGTEGQWHALPPPNAANTNRNLRRPGGTAVVRPGAVTAAIAAGSWIHAILCVSPPLRGYSSR